MIDKPAWNIPTSPTSPTQGGNTQPNTPSTQNTVYDYASNQRLSATNPTNQSRGLSMTSNANLQDIMNQEEIETKERQRHSKRPLTNVQVLYQSSVLVVGATC